jgi:anti-sigma-K factor RskA
VSPDRDHDQVQELLGAYALDAVEELERRDIEAHLATCPRCRAEVSEHLETAAMLAAVGERAPDGVWDEISERLDERPSVIDLEAARTDRPRPRQPLRWVVAAAAVAAAVALGVAVTEQQQRIEQLAAEADEAGLARAAAAAAVRDDARLLTLASETGDVRAEAVILPDGRGYLVEDSLRPLPTGRTYQLWALGGPDPISAGVLGRDPGVVAFTVDPSATGLAITPERAGGVVAPEHPPVAAAEEAVV